MNLSRAFLWTMSISVMPIASIVHGQDYPNKPVRILCIGPGGSSDFTARLLASGISAPLNQNVVVENRPGLLGMEAVSKAAPDGYTLLMAGGNFWTAPLIEKTAYDPVRDFSAVTLVVTSPALLVVHPALPVKSVKELIALAKARPGQLNYSSATTGGAGHLAAELFNEMAHTKIVRIPYKNTGQSITDLMGGHVQLSFAQTSAVEQYVKSGRLRALAVTSVKPSPLMPGLPTVAATLPGYEAVNFLGVFAPANTPPPIINKLHAEIVRWLARPEVKERFRNTGVETVGSSPEELAAAVKADIARLSKVIKNLNIKAD